ncbi:MAG: hypothetical protein R2880_04095 [Deinococcales bacterium]
MLPYGIVPSYLSLRPSLDLSQLSFSLGARLIGQDITGQHSYQVIAGYHNKLAGQLYGAFLYGHYEYSPKHILSVISDKDIYVGLDVGMWPYYVHLKGVKETALGVKGFAHVKIPIDKWVAYTDLEAGLVHLSSRGDVALDGRLRLMLSSQSRDLWNYVSKGPRFGLSGIWTADTGEPSWGAWLFGSYYGGLEPLLSLPGTLELAAQTGYRQSLPITTAKTDWSIYAQLGYRYTLDTSLRYGDGLYSLERISFQPRLRSWYDDSFHLGADLSISFDTVLSYMAPVSFGLTLGYAEGFWYSFGLDFVNF